MVGGNPARSSDRTQSPDASSKPMCPPDSGGRRVRISRASAETRYWAKVDRSQLSPGGCWNWTGAQNGAGYGVFGRWTSPVKLVLVHRYAWELEHGHAPPEGMVVRHRCDNPSCVQPEHLLIGTQKDNVQDCLERGRFLAGGLTPETYAAPRRARRLAARLSRPSALPSGGVS